jgi:hypothetical protein
MALHDSAMSCFSQWWTRSVRGGYGALDVARRFARGNDGLFVRQVRSARLWGLGWPIACLSVGFAVSAMAGARWGMAAAALVACAAPLQMLRLAIKARRRVVRFSDAIAYGVLAVVGKWANLVGQYRYLRDRSAGKTQLIEYKAPRPAKDLPPMEISG